MSYSANSVEREQLAFCCQREAFSSAVNHTTALFTQVCSASSGCKEYLGAKATDFLGIELYCAFRIKGL